MSDSNELSSIDSRESDDDEDNENEDENKNENDNNCENDNDDHGDLSGDRSKDTCTSRNEEECLSEERSGIDTKENMSPDGVEDGDGDYDDNGDTFQHKDISKEKLKGEEFDEIYNKNDNKILRKDTDDGLDDVMPNGYIKPEVGFGISNTHKLPLTSESDIPNSVSTA